MSKIFQLEGGQYEHPNEYKLVSTIRGTTILQPEFGTVIIEGDVIEASTHNTIQKNGVLASKVNVTMESTDTVLVPVDMVIESDLFNELKIMLLFETGTTLPSNSFIKLKDANIPIANVNEYIVNANTPLLFLYFDSKFYAYKAGEGASTGAESLGDLSDVTLTSPTSGQALVYNGTKFVNKTVEEPESLGDLSDVTLTSPTSGQALVYNGTKFVNKTISGGGGGASKLDDLSDVVITAPTTNQTLVYNGTNFINKIAVTPPPQATTLFHNPLKILNAHGEPTGAVIDWEGTQVCYDNTCVLSFKGVVDTDLVVPPNYAVGGGVFTVPFWSTGTLPINTKPSNIYGSYTFTTYVVDNVSSLSGYSISPSGITLYSLSGGLYHEQQIYINVTYFTGGADV